MKYLLLIFAVVILLPSVCHSQYYINDDEKIIRAYFNGWTKKDWSVVSAQLAQDFTFTSPAPDDHITTEQFHKKCWVQAEHIKGFEFVRMISRGNETFAIMHVITNDGRKIRNFEFFTLENGKIKSIEVFFGGGGQGFPTNAMENK